MKVVLCLILTITMVLSCQPKKDMTQGYVSYNYIVYFGDTIPTSNTFILYSIYTDDDGNYTFNFDAIVINDDLLKYIPTNDLKYELNARKNTIPTISLSN